MTAVSLSRSTVITLVAGAAANVLFLLSAGGGHITGAHFMTTGQWALSHQSHFIAGLLFLFGAIGLQGDDVFPRGALGTAAAVLSVAGSALFVATGAITAFVLPVVASAAPQLLEADGALFNPPLATVAVAVVTFALGWFLVGLVFWRTGVLPRWASALLMTGALLQGLPPRPFGPFPWAVLPAGGVLMALGVSSLLMRRPSERALAPRAA